MWSVLTRVFSKGRYTALAAILFFLGLTTTLILPNASLVWQVISLETVSIWSKLVFIASLYGSIWTNFTLTSAFYTLLLLVMFSINTCLFLFYIRRMQKVTKGHGRLKAGSTLGLVSGAFGIGCATCGSVILTGLAASLGATGLLVALPLKGGEMAVVGILLLAWTIHYLSKKINDPFVCAVD